MVKQEWLMLLDYAQKCLRQIMIIKQTVYRSIEELKTDFEDIIIPEKQATARISHL